jgi:acyl-CoA reductase-like NAD-dependent aldehyde dehydrogenase
MKVFNKFNSTEIGEVENIEISELKSESHSNKMINVLKMGQQIINILENLLNKNEFIMRMSMETGKTLFSCKNEVRRTIYLIKYRWLPILESTFGDSPRRVDSFKEFRAVSISSYLPVYTMICSLVNAIKEGNKPILIHNVNAPISTVVISNEIFNTLKETEDLIFDVLDNHAEEKFDKKFTNCKLEKWGSHDDLLKTQKIIKNNEFLWHPDENGVSIMGDKSHMEMASNSLRKLSYEGVSNSCLRSQIYFIGDKDYVFFKNRIVEFLKREAKSIYGPDGNINYFNVPEQIEESREDVKKLLQSGFEYIDSLPETVHLLEDPYGEIFQEVDQLRGPIVQLVHFKSIRDAIDKAEKLKNSNFINIYTNSYDQLEYIRERSGKNMRIFRNLEESYHLLC